MDHNDNPEYRHIEIQSENEITVFVFRVHFTGLGVKKTVDVRVTMHSVRKNLGLPLFSFLSPANFVVTKRGIDDVPRVTHCDKFV